MKISQPGINLIKTYEGLQLTSYRCPAGVWTIGYGHTGPDVKPDMKLNEQQSEILLRKDLVLFERAITDSVKVELNQNQFDALVSFVFNVGIGAFKNSTLLRRLNAKEDILTVARCEFPRWDKADGRVLEGLKRRRASEVELFCKEAPKLKTGLIEITSKVNTWLKKRPIASYDLPNEEKSKVYSARKLPGTILDQKDKHTLLEFGYGLGTWWVYDEHWSGLMVEATITPYAIKDDLHYLRNFPYFYQTDNGPEGWRQCQSSSIAMVLKYLDVPGINDDTDYLKYVLKHGDTTGRYPHFNALEELGMIAQFTQSANDEDVKDQIDKGLPVVAGMLHRGHVSAPRGSGHFVVITGYDDKSWLVQDPYGELDLVEGEWVKTGPTSGRNLHYSFKNMNPRFFYGGGANGWCWLNFRKR